MAPSRRRWQVGAALLWGLDREGLGRDHEPGLREHAGSADRHEVARVPRRTVEQATGVECSAHASGDRPLPVRVVKHAGPAALDTIEPMLAALRGLPGLKEKSRGTFYRGSKAFIHFHEDPAGMFADVRLTDEFERMRVSTGREQDACMRKIRALLGGP